MKHFAATLLLVALTAISQQSAAAVADAGTIDEKCASMLTLFNTYHFQPIELNEAATLQIENRIINTLDPLGLIFLKQDIETINAAKLALSYDKASTVRPYLKTLVKIYRQRLKETKNIISTLSSQKIIFNDQHLFYSKKNTETYAETPDEIKNRWRIRITLGVLQRHFRRHYEGKNLTADEKLFASERDDLTAAEIHRCEKMLESVINPAGGFESYISAIVLNAIAQQFDPHSAYLTPEIKKNFEAMLSAKSLGFGLQFKEDMTGLITIARIIPGSPAFKSGRLNKDDAIVKLAIPQQNREFSAADIDCDDLERMLNDNGFMKIIITVRKKSGTTVEVPLTKEKIVSEENLISSVILSGGKKIGYIALPAFYMEWDATGVPACANDIAKEILKLKRDGIDGLILDLRNNGGGSVNEANLLAGIFIDEGPLAIVQGRDGKASLIKDVSRGALYAGPLLVMVNNGSASASEFFSATMKDYNRAIIVGSTTFGKGTSQQIFPLVKRPELITPQMYSKQGMDFVKITTAMYYNLSLQTHQQTGITPHVPLPDINDENEAPEKGYTTSLKPGSVEKKVVLTKDPEIPAQQLSAKSRGRTRSIDYFKNISNYRKQIDFYFGSSVKIPLDFKTFTAVENTRFALYSTINKAFKAAQKSFTTTFCSGDADLISIDPYRKDLFEGLADSVSNDPYITESYNILSDFINKK